MMITEALLVGADNHTGQIDLERLAAIMIKHVAAFTIIPSRGYWHGVEEPSAEVLVSADASDIADAIADIKSDLAQDAVAVITLPPLRLESSPMFDDRQLIVSALFGTIMLLVIMYLLVTPA